MYQAGQAQQSYQGREQGQELVVGQAPGHHGAAIGHELLTAALEGVAPASFAELQWCVRASRALGLRGDRLPFCAASGCARVTFGSGSAMVTPPCRTAGPDLVFFLADGEAGQRGVPVGLGDRLALQPHLFADG